MPINISNSPVRSSGCRIEDDHSPKPEDSVAKILINQIPTSKRELAPKPVIQTNIDPNGFKKPALPPKARIGPNRSPILSAEAVVPRHTPFKRPAHISGKRDLLDPVETDLESSQELPPLKRAKLAPPRRDLFAQPKSFSSINQEAQDVDMRDHVSPDLMEEPLRGWPSRDGHVPKSQLIAVHEGLAQGTGIETETRQTQIPLQETGREAQNKLPGSQPALDRKSLGPSRNHQDEHEKFDQGQHGTVGQDAVDPKSDDHQDNVGAEVALDRIEDNGEARDTFDIPSSSSPELPASAQASRRVRLKMPGLRSRTSGRVQDRNLDMAKVQQPGGTAQTKRLSRVLTNDGNLDYPSVNVNQSLSLQSQNLTSDPAQCPQTATNGSAAESANQLPTGHIYKSGTHNFQGSRSHVEATSSAGIPNGKLRNMEEENTDEEERDEMAQKKRVKPENKQQASPTALDSPQQADSTSAKPLLPGSTITSSATQRQPRIRKITPAQKGSLETSGNRSSILRSSSSRDRRSGTSVSFADIHGEPALDPSPTRQSASFVPVNLLRNRKSEETVLLGSNLLESIKNGFKGVLKDNGSVVKETNTTKKLIKGKARAEEPQGNLSPGPNAAKPIAKENIEDDEHWEPYTIDGNIGPSRNPGIAKSQRLNYADEPAALQSGIQTISSSNVAKLTERAQSISSDRTESSGESSGSSTPRSPAKEVVSPATANSAEVSVVNGLESGSEGEQSESEDSKEVAAAEEDVRVSVHKSSTRESESEDSGKAAVTQEKVRASVHRSPPRVSSTSDGPDPTNRSMGVPLETNDIRTNSPAIKVQDLSSEDESEDDAEEAIVGRVLANDSTDALPGISNSRTNGPILKAQDVSSSEGESEDYAEEDDAADLQLQSENRRSIELGSSQKKPDRIKVPGTKASQSSAPQPKSSQVSQAKVPNLPKQAPNVKPSNSTNAPRASNGRFLGVSALNAKSKTKGTSQKPFSNSMQPIRSNGTSSARKAQIDSPDDSNDSSTDDSEVEILADSKGRQSRNKALEGLRSVQNRKSYLAPSSWLSRFLT